MLQLLKKSTLFLTLALAVIALCAMGTNAQAADLEVDFSGVTNTDLTATGSNSGNWHAKTGADAGAVGGGTLNWAAYATDPPGKTLNRIWLRSTGHHLKFDSSNTTGYGAGSLAVIDFNGAEVTDFMQVELGFNAQPFFYRILVREKTSNNWYATVETEKVEGGPTAATIPDTAVWTQVTNAAAMGLDAPVVVGSPAPFTGALATFAATPTDISTGITLDRACVYITRANLAADDAVFNILAFRSTVAGATIMPDVRNMQPAAARALLDSLVAGFTPLVYDSDTNPSVFVESDVWDAGSINSQVPGVGSLLAPGATITFTVSKGMQNSWVWLGTAGDGDFGNGANWAVRGFFDPVLVADGGLGGRRQINPAEWPPLPGCRLIVANGQTATLSAGTIPGHNLILTGGSTVIVQGSGVIDCTQQGIDKTGVAVNAGTSYIGRLSGEAINLSLGDNTNANGTLIIKSGGTFKARNLNISDSVARPAQGTGHVRLEAGGTFEGGISNLDVGDSTTAGGVSIGILEIVGPTTFTLPNTGGGNGDDLDLNTSGTILRFTADATGFGTIDLPNSELAIYNANVNIEVDATLLSDTTNPTTFTLVRGRNGMAINAGFSFVDNFVLTPPTGGSKAEWSIKRVDTDDDGDLDGIALIREVVLPPEFVTDPTSDLVLSPIFLGQSSSTGTLTVTNGGDIEFNITNFAFSGDEGFTLASPSTSTLPINVGSSDSIPFVVNFNTQLLANPSSAVGLKTGTLTIESDAPNAASTDIAVSVNLETDLPPTAIKPELWMLYED